MLPVALLALVAGWSAAGRTEAGRVADGVELAGIDIGGMDRAGVGAVVDRIAGDLSRADVVVTAPAADGAAATIALDPGRIGLAVDREAVLDAALGAGRGGAGVLEPLRWLARTVSPLRLPLVVDLDRAALTGLVVAGDPTGRVEPVEPTVAASGDSLVAVAGIPGHGLDPAEVAEAVVAAARRGRPPLAARVEPTSLPPRFADGQARALVREADDLTSSGAEVRVGATTAPVPAVQLRSWLTARVAPGGDRLELVFAPDRVVAGVVALVGDAGEPPGPPSLGALDGRLLLVPGAPGTRCCSPEAATVLLDALRRRDGRPIALPLTDREPAAPQADARLTALGIQEKVGEFTTYHPSGQARVANIHLVADVVRGSVIPPGGTFSLNGTAGPYTSAKGYVPAGVITNGVFSEGLGGGVSQFTTTLFNAAFFGGLDLVQYQSHSIYISRYPYGREATVWFPNPDLVIRNSTPNAVLIWTEYTSTSVTVSLWSTRYVTGEQTGQTTSPNGACTRVSTERTRTYTDGRTVVDHVFANYQPDEGLGC